MFKPVKVFDVSQTDGKPLPHLASTLTGSVEQYEIFVEALRRSAPVPISFKAISPDTDGYFSPSDQAITIREGMSEVQTISALVHEIAHSKLHNYEKQQTEAATGKDGEEPVKKDRHTEEVEAESVSYAVCQYFGIETGENSFGYIATWSQGKELKELRASLETINKTASELITDVDRNFAEICKERGIDPKALPEQEQDVQEPETPAQEPEAITPEPIAPDAYQLYATDLCDYLEQLHQQGQIEQPFVSMAKEENAAALADMLRHGDFDSANHILSDVAERSGILTPAELLKRLLNLSDEWDKGLSYRMEKNVLQDGNSFVLAFEGETSHGAIFSGPTNVCEKLLTELKEGTMTARQARALNRQWEEAGQEMPPGDPEKLYLLDDNRFLHIQTTDTGFDYKLYDVATMKELDGGQFGADSVKAHPAVTQMDAAYQEVCALQGLEPVHVEDVPLYRLDEIRSANEIPAAPELQMDTPAKENLPDPTITPRMMDRYGYADQDMLPLSKDRALELAERDVTIYMLYHNGTAEMAFDSEEIVEHEGIFGVSRDEWESIKAEIPPRDVEKRFMNNPNDALLIYQLNETAPRDRRFTEYSSLDSPPQRDHYDAIYTADLNLPAGANVSLDSFYEQYNLHRPKDFTGHSMSVSDIIAIKQGSEVSYHYCDSFGFKELLGFNQPENYLKAAEMSLEDDYGMIDGIINNGPKQPTVAELEAQVKAGQTISLMDLAAAVQAERKVPKAKEERPSIMERLKQPLPKQTKKSAPQRSAEQELI